MPQAPSIVGMPSGFTPAEYPKAVYNKEGKSALARNPGHMEELSKAGYGADYNALPVAAPSPKSTTVTSDSESAQKLSEAQSTIKKMTDEMMSLVSKHAAEISEFIEGSKALKEELSAAKDALLKHANPVPAANAPTPASTTTPKLTPPLQPKASK